MRHRPTLVGMARPGARTAPIAALVVVGLAGAACVGTVGGTPSGPLRLTDDAGGTSGTSGADAGALASDDAATLPGPDGGVASGSDAAAPGRDATAPVGRDAGPVDAPGDPNLHTREEVCAAWAAAQVENAPNGGFTKSDAMCDPGQVSREGLDDALRRLDFHRWLAGIGPAREGEANHAAAQACALISAWNPAGQQAHSPPASATCYTPAGASAAGSSNIAWGNGTAASAIDQWIVDRGSESTFGHRRWLLNPPLSGVGIGAYQGGNNYGSASCIIVFGSGGASTGPDTIAYPPPGFVPQELARLGWTLQGRVPQRNLTVTVTAQSSGMVMPTTITALIGNYGGSSGLYLERDGWQPTAGETYQVEVGGDGAQPFRYAISPVDCP